MGERAHIRRENRMEIVRQGWHFEEPVDGMAILKKIERAGRVNDIHPEIIA